MFDKFSTGNFYLREQGMGNGKDWGTQKNNKIQSPPLTREGLGWGQTIVDTLIMT